MKKTDFIKIGLMIKLSIFMLLLLLTSCKNDKLKEVNEYYENGNLKSIEYFNNNGEQEGESKYYKENGKLDHSIFYNNGEVCKTIIYYDNGAMHYYAEIGKNDTIRRISYHKNGKMEMIGNAVKEKRVGWWKKHNSDGNLIEEYEFFIVDNEEHLNQFKVYDKNGNIKEEESSFFTLTLSDTIQIGKNIGKLKYYSNPEDFELRFIYIIVENEYPDGLIKKDTFTDDIDKLWFGIYAKEKGRLKVKGIIQEELVHTNKNSSELIINRHNKYFEKEVFVEE